jgi:hypothetical protein
MAKKKESENAVAVVQQKSIGQITRDAYVDFGYYYNTHRHLAGLDGLKISYRRLIYSAMQFPKGKLAPSTTLINYVANFHPHGLTSMNEMSASLYKSGIFAGEGSFGYTSICGVKNPPANERYTHTALSDLYWELMGDLIKEVPYSESPIGPLEPNYLPLPLPLCLRWDTKIRLTDGRDVTIKELTEEFNSGKTNYVLSCNDDGDFSVSKIINASKTRTTGDYVRITLDNGEVINSTRDHLFMLRDGSYLEAEKLKVGDSLMPGYLGKTTNGRTSIKNNYSLTEVPIYKLSDLYNIHNNIYCLDSDDSVIHHVDGNKLNDNPDNLIRLSRKESHDTVDFLEMEKTYNHKIVSIEFINDSVEDFYDITVDSKYHNFLLSAGIVVHNCLYMKTLSSGMGVGISMIYPNFSAWSLYQAYLNNNPNLLEPNVDLILDKSNSELDKLWTTGEGRVIYVYKISRQKSPDGKTDGILFETKDGTEIFTPYLKEFNKLEAEGKVFIEDLTDIDGAKLFIGRIPGARGITIDDIEKIAQKCCFKAIKFALNVTNGSSAFRIPLYNWIDYTYKNYISLITNVNKKRIDKCKFDILVQESIPVVAGFINSKPDATDEEIVKATKVPQEVVDIIMSKPISYIRKNKDTSDRIKVLKDRLVNLQKFNAVKFTEEIIKKL